eukprot:COSAG06_NODE_3062_length_5904_cov_62.822911_5_plen_198_part_00
MCFIICAQAEAEALRIENAQLRARLVSPDFASIRSIIGASSVLIRSILGASVVPSPPAQGALGEACQSFTLPLHLGLFTACVFVLAFVFVFAWQEQVEKAPAAAAAAKEEMAQTASDELLEQTKLALAAERRCGTHQLPSLCHSKLLRWLLSEGRLTHNLTMNRFRFRFRFRVSFLFLFRFRFRFLRAVPTRRHRRG